MGLTHFSAPLNVGYSNSPANPANTTTIPTSSDLAPSMFFGGTMIMDPRFGYRGGGGTEASALLGIGLGLTGNALVVDGAPATKAVNNIAVAAAPTTGTNMTLVSSTGAGVTVTTSSTFIQQTGKTVASGALALDSVPALVFFGTNKSHAVPDPTKNISRAVAITASSGAAGGAFLVTGNDLYGYPQTEKITAASSPSGATTTNGKKAFKFIRSVTAQVTDTFSYSVGTADLFGFPLLSQEFPMATVGWAGALVASSTGYVAAVSSTATNTTGDVRGTYAVQSASNGTVVLQMFQTVSPANISSMTGYFGVTPA